MALSFKTSAANFAALPSVGNTDGDLRRVADTGLAYRWDVDTTAWVAYATVDAVETIDAIGLVGTPSAIVIDGADITSGTIPVARIDTGTTANKIVKLNGSAQLPAVDGSLLTGIASGTITSVVAGVGLDGGGASGAVTIDADVGVGPNQLVQRSGTGAYPAGDGAAITVLSSAALTGALPAVSGAALTALSSSALTGALPALDASALTDLNAAELSGALPALDGSALTAISSSALSGALPAIDGSALTNLPSGGLSAVADTDSVNLTDTTGTVSADLKLSSDAASASNLKATTTVKSGAGAGLHVEIPYATTSAVGVLTDTDWDTFNNKEPAITAGTSAQYLKGDKSLGTSNLDSLAGNTSGSAPSSTKLGYAEILVFVDPAVTTGVGATGVWGTVGSASLAAGDWLIYGQARIEDNGAVMTGPCYASISESAASSGGATLDVGGSAVVTGFPTLYPLSVKLKRLSAPATMYLTTNCTYSAGTPKHGGILFAMRIR